MFRSTILATILTATLSAQCNPTISQHTTLNSGWFCSTITYTYVVCNPSPCVFPIKTIKIKFGLGTGLLDGGSITTPSGWGGSISAASDELVLVAGARFAEIQPGDCKTFSVTTNCNPRGIEGIQTADFFAFGGGVIQSGGRTTFVLAGGGFRNFLGGADEAPIGQTYFVTATSAMDPFGQNLLLASPWVSPTGLNVQGFGTLFLDPILIIPVAPIPLNQDGVGRLQLPIPPSLELIGGQLSLQSLTLSTPAPRLSNPKTVTFG